MDAPLAGSPDLDITTPMGRPPRDKYWYGAHPWLDAIATRWGRIKRKSHGEAD